MLRNPFLTSETDAQPTPMAYVHTKVAVDIGGIRKAQHNIAKSYFFHAAAGSISTSELFSIKQNNIVFSIGERADEQMPLVRAALNGLDYKPIVKELISKIDSDHIRLDRECKDSMIQEILMSNINIIGSVKADGFSFSDDGRSDKSMDTLTVESSGVVQVRVRNKPLPIGAEAEFKVPLQHEWMTSDEWKKDNGKLTLYVDPIEKMTEFEKLSQYFYKYNPYHDSALTELVHKMMRNKDCKAKLPSSLKVVYAFDKLVRVISLLSRQRAVAAGILRPKKHSDHAFPSFQGAVAAGEQSKLGLGMNFKVQLFKNSLTETMSSSELQLSTDVIETPVYNSEKFYISDLKNARNYFSATDHLFIQSMNVLNFTAIASQLFHHEAGIKHISHSHKNPLRYDGFFHESLDEENRRRLTTRFNNYYNHLYHTLIMMFLPSTIREYYAFGFKKSDTGNDPEVNLNLWKHIKVVKDDEEEHISPFQIGRTPSFKTLEDRYVLDYSKDSARSSNLSTECLPSFFDFLIMYMKEKDFGYRMSVVDSAEHREKGTVYVRA